jgi:valyl-tRNA synthetase
MTVKQIISQAEKMFGRQPEQYMLQLINDALDDISSKRQNYTVNSLFDLKQKQRWYTLTDQVIDILKIEIKDTNDRYVMIPKLADSHRLLRGDSDSADDSLT